MTGPARLTWPQRRGQQGGPVWAFPQAELVSPAEQYLLPGKTD
jgi:hypothetical protein